MLRIEFPTSCVPGAMILVISAQIACAAPLPGSWRLQNPARVVTIVNNRGGYVVDFALQLHHWTLNGTQVRFAGRCQSACTLYLALPKTQSCISRGASFTFHAPIASSQSAVKYAKIYMIKTYPSWVRLWIDGRGGLSSRPMTMDYAYASKFVRPCTTETVS